MLPVFRPNIRLLALVYLFCLPGLVFSEDSQHSSQFDVKEALHYIPSKVIGAIGFSVFFLISFFIIWHLVRNKDWWGLCLPIGGFCEAVGFFLRIFIGHPSLRGSLGYYIAMNLFVVLSPAAFLAFNYILFGRLIRICVGREHSYIRPEIVGRTFVLSDVATFLVQASGGSMEVQNSLAQAGRVVFLIGIIAQGVSYVIYVALVAAAQHSTSRAITLKGLDTHKEPWWKVFPLIYFSSIFIIIRSIYRIIETAQGSNGYLLTHEWAFLAFDSIPLAIAIAAYAIHWPGWFVPKEGSASPSQFGMLPMSPTAEGGSRRGEVDSP